MSEVLYSERRCALVIGNSAYININPLNNPVNDAKKMADSLERLDFSPVISGFDLDIHGMADVAHAFENSVKNSNVALFFFAGHGLQHNEQNYLLPIDAQIKTAKHLDFSAVLFEQFLNPISEEVDVSIIFLDACRHNSFANTLSRSVGSRSVINGLAKVAAVRGAYIAFSTKPGETAIDGKGPNSPFTTALLKHIETEGQSINNLMIDVRNDVLTATNGHQNPWEQSNLRKNFFFKPKSETTIPTALPPKPKLTPEQIKIGEALENWKHFQLGSSNNIGAIRSFVEDYPFAAYARARLGQLVWERIQTTNDPTELNKFLTEFPKSTFAREARARLLNLQRIEEKNKWKVIRFSKKTNEVEQFLQEFPKGKYVNRARRKLSRLNGNFAYRLLDHFAPRWLGIGLRALITVFILFTLIVLTLTLIIWEFPSRSFPHWVYVIFQTLLL